MTRTGKAAMAVAILASALSVLDAVSGGITGGAVDVWDDNSGQRWVIVAVDVLLVALFALLTAVLVQQADRLDGASRVVRWIRRTLLADLAVLAGVFVVGTVLVHYPGPVEAVAGIAFVLMFPLGAVLGVCLVRRPGLRLPAVLLVASAALIPLAMLADSLAPGWGHPGYAEAALYIGLALLARGGRRPMTRSANQPAPAATNT